MKKIYAIFAAMMVAMTISAEPVQQDIDLSAEAWGWGWGSSVANVEGGLQCTITGEWSAVSTGWGDLIDMSGWDKLVIVVENIEGCDGEWWYLKALIRDSAFVSEDKNPQMTFELSKDHNPAETNYLVIDLTKEVAGFDKTAVKVLAIQSQFTGSFLVSRAFLEKAGDEQGVENVSIKNNGILYNLLGQPVDEDYKGIVILNGRKMIVR